MVVRNLRKKKMVMLELEEVKEERGSGDGRILADTGLGRSPVVGEVGGADGRWWCRQPWVRERERAAN